MVNFNKFIYDNVKLVVLTWLLKLKQNLQPSIHTRFISFNTKSGSGEEIGLSFSLTNSGERVLE